jgi:hypothetical protein
MWKFTINELQPLLKPQKNAIVESVFFCRPILRNWMILSKQGRRGFSRRQTNLLWHSGQHNLRILRVVSDST